ncbi:uncharacterized protein [Nicotiana tomentosiformis]|uniref:uncharacterized protein n=1 Tax=Nicotiana tomentosiformis TaxID=4098 RepID=UPI00388C5B79
MSFGLKNAGATYIVSRRGIELDPSKIKAIQELPPPKNKTEMMSLLGRLNYISRFIAQLTMTCEPIFKLLKKNVTVKWTDECQETFDKIKRYLSNPSVLVPPELGRPLILYLTVLDNSFGCVLGQHDITGKKEQAIYYLSKKFNPYEVKYTLLEKTCFALTWVAQKLKHYLSSYTTYLISRIDPLKTAMKAQALADQLAENPVDEEYEPLKTYFPDEEVMYVDEVDHNEKPCWKLFFDGAANIKGVGIGDHAYCNVVEEELDGEPWFHDSKEYIKLGVYLVHAICDQKRTIRRLASGFFLSGGILYKRTQDLGLLRCIDAKQAFTIMSEAHSKVHSDLIHSPPSELYTMSVPWTFVAWGMNVIGPIELAASNEHRFILVAIDYFTK